MSGRQKSNNAETFLNLLAVSEPGGIERQERMGTATLARSSSKEPAQLPKDMGSNGRATLEASGVVFGKDVDDLFILVTLPEGWSIKASDHRLYSYVLDAVGRERAEIFYKAAFYDRNADLKVLRRYSLQSRVSVNADGQLVEYGSEHHTHMAVIITDGKMVIEVIERFPKDIEDVNEQRAVLAKMEVACKRGGALLDQRFPNWKDPAAYWD